MSLSVLLLLDRCEIVYYDGDEKNKAIVLTFFLGYQSRLGIFFFWLKKQFVEIAREKSFMGWKWTR